MSEIPVSLLQAATTRDLSLGDLTEEKGRSGEEREAESTGKAKDVRGEK